MTSLVKYETACRSLAEAHSVDEVKDIRDKAEAMRVYAIQSKNVDLEVMASDIRLRGERRLGELLIIAKASGEIAEGRRPNNCSDEEQLSRITLDSIGVDRKLSSRAQKLGGIAEQAFEAMVARTRADIQKRGSRAAIGALSVEDKKQRRDNRERVLGACQSALPDKRYGVILADPEWRFEPWSRTTGMDRAADNHYPTSCTEVIAARDVPSIAAKDCVLFLWATAPMLPHALAVMDAWGFDYKSQFIWFKDRPGTGYWVRNQHELLLIGTRGEIPAPAPGTQGSSVIAAPRGAHSAKPEIFLEMIERLFPTLPKIELNRRGAARPGWDAWGNEALADDGSPTDPTTGEILPTHRDVSVTDERLPQGAPSPESSDDDGLGIPGFLERVE